MRTSSGRWGGLVAIAGLGVCLLFALRVPRAVSALTQKHEQIRQLQTEKADLTRDVDAKRERIRKLRSSRSEQELVIRKWLKLQRPGETSIVIQDSTK